MICVCSLYNIKITDLPILCVFGSFLWFFGNFQYKISNKTCIFKHFKNKKGTACASALHTTTIKSISCYSIQKRKLPVPVLFPLQHKPFCFLSHKKIPIKQNYIYQDFSAIFILHSDRSTSFSHPGIVHLSLFPTAFLLVLPFLACHTAPVLT